MDFVLTYFTVGLVLAIPVWIVWQRAGSRRGLAALRRFDSRDAERCDIQAVVLRARLLPQPRLPASASARSGEPFLRVDPSAQSGADLSAQSSADPSAEPSAQPSAEAVR